ncbi:hypothetical protein Thi970DRAFT_04722 [Thiorhodovibrio frisius]|uniref:PIN domain-containing protein n=1 Tax=Thiorhodovibrio frisius TaxID=631362 RepID=H8Z891_9GAMM|nr:hypothetical protein Thi970DRAFT_04722 [Thiorhodovibrio frisius]WPL22099.1 hypothetical protein Thiofri_02250 [Thiorhodovibrio frisius]
MRRAYLDTCIVIYPLTSAGGQPKMEKAVKRGLLALSVSLSAGNCGPPRFGSVEPAGYW